MDTSRLRGSGSDADAVRVRGDGPGLLRALAARLPHVRLLTDAADRESYRRDETAYYAAGLPLAVALPVTTLRVADLVRLCGEFDVPIVPRGAGTGLSGAAAGIEGALTIAFTRMDRILEIDPANLTVTTQPGVVNAELKGAVAARGLFYAPDPASYESCTIGGNAAVRCLDAARADLYEAALSLGGTVTGEHGIGVARRDWLVRQRGEDAVAVMRSIKRALDPRDLLNPGRMLP